MTFNPPNPGIFQGQISSAIVSLRDAFQTVANIYEPIAAQGGASYLENILGLSANDAAAVYAALANHYALSLVYQGAAPPAALDYRSNAQPLWSGM